MAGTLRHMLGSAIHENLFARNEVDDVQTKNEGAGGTRA